MEICYAESAMHYIEHVTHFRYKKHKHLQSDSNFQHQFHCVCTESGVLHHMDS